MWPQISINWPPGNIWKITIWRMIILQFWKITRSILYIIYKLIFFLRNTLNISLQLFWSRFQQTSILANSEKNLKPAKNIVKYKCPLSAFQGILGEIWQNGRKFHGHQFNFLFLLPEVAVMWLEHTDTRCDSIQALYCYTERDSEWSKTHIHWKKKN